MKAQRRGRNIALAGAAVQAVVTVAMLVIGLQTGAKAAVACAWLLAAGVLVWLMAALLHYCRQLELQEEAELEAIASRGEEATGIFDRRADLALRPARSRSQFVARWVVPIFTLVLAAYHVTLGVLVLMALRYMVRQETLPPIAHTGPGVLFGIVIAFISFLFSRYATGMASRSEWRPLRAPASYLLAGSLVIAAVAAGFVSAWWGYRLVDVVVAFAVPIAQFILAAELMVSFLLDLYRPRVPGQERRLSYDSRILNLLAEPGRIGHSIADTLNYQFGFEVSKTWFYRLLSKSLVPLVIFGAVVLVLLSSVVVVYEGQKCVVLHWGRRDSGRLLGPGLHVKWPWPVDTARLFDVARVYELRVGVGGERTPRMVNGHELNLWTDEHGRYEELDFLLAIPPEAVVGGAPMTQPAGAEAEKQAPPPVHIIKLVVAVQYRIADPYKFGYRFADAPKLLEGVAYREMVRYCASATLDTKLGGPTNRPEAIMTSGWGPASVALEKRIRDAIGPDGLDLGVDIASVKLVAVHPPFEAAEAFEAVLAAERRQDELRYQAEGVANRTLAAVAGDPDAALELALAIRRLGLLREAQAELRRDPRELHKAMQARIRRAAEDLKMLLKEIRREGLLGELAGGAAPAARDPDEMRRLAEALRAALPQIDESLRRLLEGILADDFVTRPGRGAGTARQRLAVRYMEDLVELVKLSLEGPKFDFAGALAAADDRAETLFDLAAGEPAKQVAEANAYRVKRPLAERGLVEAFRRGLPAYRASPRMFMLDRWLDVWDEALPRMTKYVIGVDPNRVEVRMNWERQQKVLGDVLGGSSE